MVLFAALAMARLQEWLTPTLGWVAFPVALALSAAIMMALAFAIERLVLRYLINQEGIILFMATIGITFFLDGFGQTLWRSEEHTSELQSLMRNSYAVF